MLATNPLYSEIRGRDLEKPKSERMWSEVKMEIESAPTHGCHWYVVHCAGSPDDRLMDTVKKLGWDVFSPKCMELRAVPKNKLTASQRNNPFPIKRPTPVTMFPRYPFLRFDLRDPLRHDVFELLGVHGMVCDGSGDRPQPAYFSDAKIEALKAKQTGGAVPIGTSVRELAYEVGEQVRIATGPFYGSNATVDEIPDGPIEKLDATARLRLLVTLFGRKTVVELSLADIEKL